MGHDAMRNGLGRIVRDTRGATVVEYALIISMIVLAIVGALNLLATETAIMWNDVSDNVTSVS
jgi:pilus assembly protein Flp/PilA